MELIASSSADQRRSDMACKRSSCGIPRRKFLAPGKLQVYRLLSETAGRRKCQEKEKETEDAGRAIRNTQETLRGK